MKKFVGTVNGKTFDNELDFAKEAASAIIMNDGNLSISSYYSYVSDEKDEEKEQVKDTDDIIRREDYELRDRKPEVVTGNKLVYPISDELKEKIKKASNRCKIKPEITTLIHDAYECMENTQSDIDEYTKKIERLQDLIAEREMEMNTYTARKEYYEGIFNIINEDKKEKNKTSEGFCNYLKSIGFNFNK